MSTEANARDDGPLDLECFDAGLRAAGHANEVQRTACVVDLRAREDTAFDRLSTGRKVGLVTGAAVGAGLYIWNVLDARTRAHDHNRQLAQRRISIGLQAGPDGAGVALGVNF